LGRIRIKNCAFSLLVAVEQQPHSYLVDEQCLLIVFFPKFFISLLFNAFRVAIGDVVGTLDLDAFRPRQDKLQRGVELMQSFERILDAERGEKGILLTPLLGGVFVGEDDDEYGVPEGAFGPEFIEDEADECMVELQDAQDLDVEPLLAVTADEQILNRDIPVFLDGFLRGGDLLQIELQEPGVAVGDGFVLVGVLEEDGPQILLDHGHKIPLGEFGLSIL
jgi:hypothetical protein